VSVTCWTYQHAPYIRQCLDGILMQETSFPYEVIVGEDGSTDGTREICIEYAERYPERIRLFLRDRNTSHLIYKGRDIMLNPVFCMMSARGKYIAICEGDDYWTDPFKLQKQVDFLEANPGYVLTFTDAVLVDENGRWQPRTRLEPDLQRDRTEDELIECGAIPPLSVCYRNVIDPVIPEMLLVLNADSFLWSALGVHGAGKYLGSEIRPAVHRLHAGGIWSSMPTAKRMRHRLDLHFWLSRYHSRLKRPKGAQLHAHLFWKHLWYYLCSDWASERRSPSACRLRQTVLQAMRIGPGSERWRLVRWVLSRVPGYAFRCVWRRWC